MLLSPVDLLIGILAARLTEDELRELARKLRSGDHNAFRRFFDSQYDDLIRFLLARGLELAEAEDLVQQAFILIWEKRNELDPQKSVRGFLYRIAYTRMLNYLRDRSRLQAVEQPDLHHSDNPDPAMDTQHTDLQEAIDRAVAALPEKRRAVFELCFLQQFTYKEAAAVLDISPKTVENHMGYALKSIRGALEDFR